MIHVLCLSLTVMSGPGGTTVGAIKGVPTTPPTRTTGYLNTYGCVAAAARVTTTGKGAGGAFVLPKSAFAQPLPDSVHWLDPPEIPGAYQVQPSLAFAGPDANALFRANAWSEPPGRGAADFTWCIGKPECTKVTQGLGHAIVRYTAGANRFGGTMRFLVSAGPNPSQIVRSLAGSTFLPFAATGARPTGAGFAVAKTDPALTGSGWSMYMRSAMGRITMGTTYLGPRPGTSVMNFGFPFTTGRVLVRQTGTQFGSPARSTLSAKGGDTVTAMGARNLSLVAGGVARTQLGNTVLPSCHCRITTS